MLSRLVLTGVVAVLLSACGIRGEGPVTPAPSTTSSERAPAAAASEPAGASDAPVELRTLLLDGERLLAEGDAPGAVEAFQAYLAFGGSEDGSARALWGLALAYLAPDDETHDAERGLRVLGSLAEEHPSTLQGRQASWLHGLVIELDQSRAIAQEQEQIIEQLREMVEQLRRIDLDRRPGGARPDSIRRPR